MATIPTEMASQSPPSLAAAMASVGSGSGTGRKYSKLRQLKDRMWVREALEDVTAAEFATSLSVETEQEVGTGAGTTTDRAGAKIWERKGKSKRAVDFDNILDKLDVRIEEMCVLSSPEVAAEMDQTCHILSRRVPTSGEDGEATFEMENTCYSLAQDMGMGSVVYTPEQREALLKQLIGTRKKLVSFIQGRGRGEEEEEDDIDGIREQLLKKTNEDETGGTTADSNGRKDASSATTFDPSLYVREDGTVDWDGALQDREALKKFGGAVWSRINGQEPDMDGGTDGSGEGDKEETDEFQAHAKAVTAKIEETEAIRAKRDQRDVLMGELQKLEEEHTRLLNSGELLDVLSTTLSSIA